MIQIVIGKWILLYLLFQLPYKKFQTVSKMLSFLKSSDSLQTR